MSERSLGLRKILVDLISTKRVEKKYQDNMDCPDTGDERREKLRRNLEAERARIEEFERQRKSLLEKYTEMSDQEFDQQFEEASAELDTILDRVIRYSDEYKEPRGYMIEFVDIEQIKNLGEFLDKLPMQFVPRKEEIGRILALAKQMHDNRVKRGEKESAEPLKIVDIGGSNAALGKLVTDLAKENGLDIEYTIVDPDARTIQKAANFYKNNKSLQFKEQNGVDFNIERYRHDTKILALMEKRKEIINQGEKKRSDLRKVLSIIISQKNSIDLETMRKYIHVLNNDFQLEFSETEDVGAFLEKIEHQEDVVATYMLRWREHTDFVTHEIESLVGTQPAQYDLVINSWMPVQIDLTNEVRQANGAAILYALEREGATGCRSDARYPESPVTLGHNESYHPGINYESKFGWVSHATPQAKHMMSSQPDRFWELQSSSASPFSNGFIIQTKNGYGSNSLSVEPSKVGIKIDGGYAWEKELDQRGGAISPVAELHDENRKLNYFTTLNILADGIVKREYHKLLAKTWD